MRKTLIIGATSAIAQATARGFAENGDRLYLLARDPEKLESVAADLRVRGASEVCTQTLDVIEYHTHQALLADAIQTLGVPDLVLIAHGSLADQTSCEASFEALHAQFAINTLGTLSLLTHLANIMQENRHGTLAVISSVAGDRGRASNYVYGSAKGALNIFLQGLEQRLGKAGVSVLTIKPGLVCTPMTESFEKGPLWASPEQVAKSIHKAILKGRSSIYTPWYWAPIMFIIRLMPNRLLRALNI